MSSSVRTFLTRFPRHSVCSPRATTQYRNHRHSSFLYSSSSSSLLSSMNSSNKLSSELRLFSSVSVYNAYIEKRKQVDEELKRTIKLEIKKVQDDNYVCPRAYNSISESGSGRIRKNSYLDSFEEIIDIPGEQAITLKKELNGENIKVVVHMYDIDQSHEVRDFHLIVTIVNADGLPIEFRGTAFMRFYGYLEVTKIKGDKRSKKVKRIAGGHKELKKRGIDFWFEYFLREYMIKKHKIEYMMLLKNINEFLEK